MGRLSDSALRLEQESPRLFDDVPEGTKFDAESPFKVPAFVAEEDGALSVTRALMRAKGALEEVVVDVVGEVSSLKERPGYKAVYFSIKDEKSTLPCQMWVNRYNRAGVKLEVGQKVRLSGRFTLYAVKGSMNFDVVSIHLVGEGYLRMQVAQLARRLEAEGLTARERKRPLPDLPELIGLVTSPQGAVVHDVLRTLRRRYPLAHVLFAGVPVEGTNVVPGMIEALQRVCAAGAQVVLLVRGGGSYENLMPFNDESLARAIAKLPVPVVTGIGHEPDTTIADIVADERASTPTHAAEAVSPGMDVLEGQVQELGRRMHARLAGRLEKSQLVLERYAGRPVLCNPKAGLEAHGRQVATLSHRLGQVGPRMVGDTSERLRGVAYRLHQAIPAAVSRDASRVESARTRLRSCGPAIVAGKSARLERTGDLMGARLPALLDAPRTQLYSTSMRLHAAQGAMLEDCKSQIGIAAARLTDLSPLAVLARGYAITRDAEGAIVKSVESVEAGEQVRVEVSDGSLTCRVEDKQRIDSAYERLDNEEAGAVPRSA